MTVEPRPSLAPPGVRVADIPCTAYYRMDGGLTEQAWRVVSPVPLDRLTPDDVEELKRVTAACYHARNPYPRMNERIAVHRVQSSLDRLASSARRRAEEEQVTANARAEAEATARTREAISTALAAALHALDDNPPAERCALSPGELRAGLVASYGPRPLPSSETASRLGRPTAKRAALATSWRPRWRQAACRPISKVGWSPSTSA